jgi:ligand-binding SRPBCC domain-containing protein
VLRLETAIAAPADVAFDLARSVDLHVRSQARHRETASADAPLLGPGDEVTFRARHFGVALELTARIVVYDRPHVFVDLMVSGPFASLRHEHRFEERAGVTTMTDLFDYTLPLAVVGRLADRLVVRRRLRRLLRERAAAIRSAAEAHVSSSP